MKRICIIIPYMYPVPAVCGGAVETLDQFLIDENEKNPTFEFTVLTTYDPKVEQVDSKYKYTKFLFFEKHKLIDGVWEFIYRVIKKLFKVYIPASPRFVSILRYLRKNKEQFDYVLFENGLSYMLPLVAKVYPKDRILSHMHWPGDGNKKIDQSFGYLLPVSQYCADEWKKVTGRTDDKIYIWNNCYDDEVFSTEISLEEKNRLIAELNIKPDEKVIIYVGRIVPEKGIKELMLALQRIETKNIRLLLIGKTNFGLNTETRFEREIRKIADTSNYTVSQVGYVHNSELYKYYAISTLAVMPTRFEEAAGMVNIEAMATGTPLITTNKGAIKEYVDDAAVVVEQREDFIDVLVREIDCLIGDPKRLFELSQKGSKRAELYTKEKYFYDFVEIINSIEGR